MRRSVTRSGGSRPKVESPLGVSGESLGSMGKPLKLAWEGRLSRPTGVASRLMPMVYGYRPLAAAVVAAAVLLTAYWAFRGGASGDVQPSCRIEQRGDWTVVRLRGSPREKGIALGAALASRVRAELERAVPAEAGMREFVLSTGGAKLAAFVPPGIREEIEGIAEGAGITFEEALFLNTRFGLAAHRLARGEGDLAVEGAVGPGPSAGALFAEGSERDLVLVVHEDCDPPLWLVARPGMAGGFLGLRGNLAAAMRP